jgi:hypothetical protein
VHAAQPAIAAALDVTVGGQGTGSRRSLAQYLARELSRRIHTGGPNFPVEGAFLTNEHVHTLSYDTPDGVLTSSLTGSGYDLSLFRLRPTG